MAGPETKDCSTVFDGIGVTEPVSHNSSSDWTSSGLEESKEEQNGEENSVGKGDTDGNKVKNDGSGHDDQAGTTSPKTNGKNGGGVEGIPKLSIDDVSGGIGKHKGCVHSRENRGRVSGIGLKLLLDGGVTLSGQVGHKISTKGNKEGHTFVK